MGFFNLLETAFFISLAITFVLIMMLVYHFKSRLVILEQKCDTMFEIMNNMIKEMKALQMRSNGTPSAPSISGGFPIDILSMLGAGRGFSQNLGAYQEEEEEEEDDEEVEFKKIIVSDTEVEEDLDDENVKVIHIDMAEEHVNSDDLPDLEEEDTEGDLEGECEPEGEAEGESKDDDTKESLDKSSDDYRKMDISYLRTLVLARGLASDTKKLKKADLVKLLSE